LACAGSPRTPATSTPSFLLATLGHAGTVHIDLKVAPEVVGIFRGLPIASRRAAARAALMRSPFVCAKAGPADAMVISPSASIATRLTIVMIKSPTWMAALSRREGTHSQLIHSVENLLMAFATTWSIVPSQGRREQTKFLADAGPPVMNEHQPLIASYRRTSAAHIADPGAPAGPSYFQAALRAATARRALRSQGRRCRPRARA
jgi:hypothetical protein